MDNPEDNSILLRVWQGQAPLSETLWFWGYLLHIPFALCAFLLASRHAQTGVDFGWILFGLLWATYIFFIVGALWRSSERYHGRLLWRILARIQCLVWILGLWVSVIIAAVTMLEEVSPVTHAAKEVDETPASDDSDQGEQPNSARLELPALLELAAEGNRDADYELGLIFDPDQPIHNGIAKDINIARTYYVSAANKEHVQAMYKLGTLSLWEKTDAHDLQSSSYRINASYLSEAVDWLRKAAERNHRPAQTALGNILNAPEGSQAQFDPRQYGTPEEGFQWVLKAAESGYEYAFVQLARFYSAGRGTPVNHQKAVYWYQKGTETSQPAESMKGLGLAYQHGLGVQADGQAAAGWFERAIEVDESSDTALRTYIALGVLYKDGSAGLSPNMHKAFNYFEKAADRGDAQSIYYVAIAYINGVGVEADPESGFRELNKAANLGVPEAKQALKSACLKQPGICK